MAIKVEFNPDLCLRNIIEYKEGRRQIEECLPDNIKVGEIYAFLKKEQRLYWIFGEVPLRETQGNEKLSRPKASVKILEVTHFLHNNEAFTRGKYQVIRLLDEKQVYFDGLEIAN